MDYNIYEVLWIIIFYSIMGWIVEVLYVSLPKGRFVNRGFLNGPYCPVYGFGVLFVVILLEPFGTHLILLFTGAVVITSAIEYITGFLLEKIFHDRWWDYSNQPFNISGYICLKNSLYWGIGCVIVIKGINPLFIEFINWIPQIMGAVILVIFMIAILSDMVVTVNVVTKLNRRLVHLEEITSKLKDLSNDMGLNIYDDVSEIFTKSEQFMSEHPDLLKNINIISGKLEENVNNNSEKLLHSAKQIDNLKERYHELLEKKFFGQNRLINAFPDLKSIKNNNSLNKIKFELDKKKSKKHKEQENQ
ncbi:MAG: putative ABC transporter permease [Lachnospiraceae bacterium]